MSDEESINDVPENDFYKFLREHEYKLEQEAKTMPEAETQIEREMISHLQSMMMDVLNDLKTKEEPDQVFSAALRGLSKVQQEQFILENMLEALKRGDKLDDLMERYGRLGLLRAEQAPSPSSAETPQEGESESNSDSGSFFLRLKKKLGRSSMILTKVTIRAAEVAKAVGKFAEVVPVIGFVGPIPTVSLQLQPKGVGVDELIDMVMEILE